MLCKHQVIFQCMYILIDVCKLTSMQPSTKGSQTPGCLMISCRVTKAFLEKLCISVAVAESSTIRTPDITFSLSCVCNGVYEALLIKETVNSKLILVKDPLPVSQTADLIADQVK